MPYATPMPTINGNVRMLAGLNWMWNNVIAPIIHAVPTTSGTSVNNVARNPRSVKLEAGAPLPHAAHLARQHKLEELTALDQEKDAAILEKHHKVRILDEAVIDAVIEQLLRSHTRAELQARARVLGLGDVTGSLAPGKWADLCCIDLRSPRSWPVSDVAAAVVYSASSRQVTDTWVAGRRLLADGSLNYLDEAAVLAALLFFLAPRAADLELKRRDLGHRLLHGAAPGAQRRSGVHLRFESGSRG